jgi:hypothetical protein
MDTEKKLIFGILIFSFYLLWEKGKSISCLEKLY